MTDTPVPQAPLIYARMIGVLKDLPAVGKDRYNESQKFAFRGIDDVVDALSAVLAKHEVFYLPEVLESQHLDELRNQKPWSRAILRVRYTFYTTDGSSVEAVMEGEGLDNADKATSKAASMAVKVALLQAFNIATKDMAEADVDAHTPPDRDVPAPRTFDCPVEGCDHSGVAEQIKHHLGHEHGWAPGEDGKMKPPAKQEPKVPSPRTIGAARAGKDAAADQGTEAEPPTTAEELAVLRESLAGMIGRLEGAGARAWSTWAKANKVPTNVAEMNEEQIADASAFVAPLLHTSAA